MHQADELSTQNNTLAYTWLVEILQNKNPNWPVAKTNNTSLEEFVIQTGLEHGVLSLCTYLLLNTPAWNTIPEAFRNQLKNSIRQETVAEMARLYELKNVLNLLAQKDIRPLLLKGTPLAHSHYSQPYLRSRCDTDLLFPNKQSSDNAWQLLQEKGYNRPSAVSGDLVSYEFACTKTDRFGVLHTFDCHWAISNRQLFARLLPYRELKQHAITVPDISDHAMTLGDTYALLFACMHLVSHQPEGNANRLIWLYDIHLLCNSFSKKDWHQFLLLSSQKKICSICLDGLTKTIKTLQTQVPLNIIEQMTNKAENETFTEKIGSSRLHIILSDFKALPGWKQRLRLLKEYCFPDISYMQKKYTTNNTTILPFLYIIRSIHGIYKILKQLISSR